MDSVINVSGSEEFLNTVINAPADKTVIVDFWAPWCGPCHTLGPIIEKAVESFGEKAMLVKINVDENQDLAARYQVQGIPSVKIFSGGSIAGEFTGALPESEVIRIIKESIPSPTDERAAKGRLAAEEGNLDQAETYYTEALTSEPGNTVALLGLAEIAIGQGDPQKASELLNSVTISDADDADIQNLYSILEFALCCAQSGGEEKIQKEVKGNNANLTAMYAASCCLAASGKYTESLDILLEIAEKDLHFNNDASKKAILRIFSIIGQNSETANEYRRRLTSLLY